MLLPVILLVAVLSGESFATKPWITRLKPSTEVESEAAAPSKKNLVQFKRMTECATNRSAFDFVDYGCWCGKGGAGKVVDDVDRCCMIHDKCYGTIADSKACGWPYELSTHFTTYKRMENSCTGCAPREAYKTKKEADCKYPLCMCDSKAAECLAKAKYHNENHNYPQQKCHTGK